MRRALAVVAAAAMVLGSLALRDRLDRREEERTTVLRLVCATELGPVCERLGDDHGSPLDLRVEAAGTTADRLARGQADPELDGWLVSAPWPEMVDGARRARVAVAVDECWRIAQRGDALDAALTQLNPEAIRRELDQCRSELGRTPGRADVEAAAASIRRQLESADRLQNMARGARDRLRRLDAQLDEAVARAVELSLGALDVTGLQPLGSDVESVVGELESLRLALEETGRGAA